MRVFGRDPARERPEVMREARFAFAPPPLYPRLTAREHVVHLTRFGAPVARAEVAEVLATVGLAGRADEAVARFSFGMRQRLGLALALLPRPRLLCLDEPTDGLDPLAILELREVLRTLRDSAGVAILLSSHLLTEVEQLVDRLLVLHEGRVLCLGTPAALRAEGASLWLRAAPAEGALAVLSAAGLEARVSDGGLALPAGACDLERVRGVLTEAGHRLEEFCVRRPTLEELLLARLRAEREAADAL